MEERTSVLRGYGYEYDEVNEAAKSILETMMDIGLPPKLAMLALARCTVIVGAPRDLLDTACRMIDDFAELDDKEDVYEPESDELDITAEV